MKERELTELRVRQAILEEDMIRRGDHVVAGLSGGADSVCLLLLLERLRGELGFTLEAVHVEHGIRGEEALGDQTFSRELCRRLKVPCTTVSADIPALSADTGMSWEEAGRRERYRIFRQIAGERQAEGRVRIAVAHHMDDQAETVLMNLCRGTGVRGIGAMAPVQGDLIRPLLELRKEEILLWLREQGQDWREDSTNTDTDYTRNCLRRRILPLLLQEINPRTVEHLAAAARQAREMDRWLEEEADRFLREEDAGPGSPAEQEDRGAGMPEGPRERVIPVSRLRALPAPVRSRVLLRLVSEVSGSARDLTAGHLEALEQLIAEDKGGHGDLPGGTCAQRRGGDLRIYRDAWDPMERFISPEQVTLVTRKLSREEWEDILRKQGGDAGKIPEKEYTKWFDYDRIKGTVEVRTRRKDDVIALAGVGHKPLRRYMIDAHIPAEVRERIAVVADERQILWVIGYRMNADYQVRPDTRWVLEVTATVKDERRLP